MPLLDSASGSDSPHGLTNLYSRLTKAKDNLRSEQRKNQKLNITVDWIQQDMAPKMPMIC